MGESSSNKGGRVSYFGPRTGPSPHTRTTKTPAQLNPTSPNARRPGAKPTQTPKLSSAPFPPRRARRTAPTGRYRKPPDQPFSASRKVPIPSRKPAPPALVESPTAKTPVQPAPRPHDQPRTPSKSARTTKVLVSRIAGGTGVAGEAPDSPTPADQGCAEHVPREISRASPPGPLSSPLSTRQRGPTVPLPTRL